MSSDIKKPRYSLAVEGAVETNSRASNIAIRVSNLSKCYEIYDTPRDRLKQFVLPSLKRMAGKRPQNYFREFWALKGVSFEVKKGETIGIIGRNGSGKSTLLQIIVGTLTPTTGEVAVQGRITALLELGSGFNPEFTGRENVYLNATLSGLTGKETDERIDSIVKFADIGEFIDMPVKTYSSGMFVRLAFAVQANIDPEIFIVDEALAVGDAYFVHRCMHRFQQMQNEGKTIILVTHDATAVRQLCDRAIWVDRGALVAIGDVSEVVDAYLAHLFSEGHDSYEAPHFYPDAIQEVSKNIADLENGSIIHHETDIANVDQRFGSRLCEIIGIGVYDKLGRPISSTSNDIDIVVRVSIKNNHPEKSLRVGVGYTFRNARGVDISSSDTIVTNTDIGCCSPSEIMTVSMVITLPILHPGFYSIIPSTGYIDESGIPVETDRIINAVVIEVSSDTKVNVGMRFNTKFKVDVKLTALSAGNRVQE